MKKIKLITCLTILSFSVSAQSLLPIRYGVKIGGNLSNIMSTANDGVKNMQNASIFGIAGGFYMEIALTDKWYIKPEIIYIQKGASLTSEYTHTYDVNQQDIHNSSHELALAYIELNPTMSYKTSDKLSIDVGPSISLLITPEYTETDKGDNDNTSAHEELPAAVFEEETIDVGINVGLSYYLTKNLVLNSRINTGLLKIGKTSKEISTEGISGENEVKENLFELKNSGMVFSAIYLF